MARSEFWNDTTLAQLRVHVLAGRKSSEIAKIMGVSYSSTYAQVIKINMTKPDNANNAEDRRPCLKCKKPFDSTGIGNRICRNCSNGNQIYAACGCW